MRDVHGSTGAVGSLDIEPPESPNVTAEELKEKGDALWGLIGVITGNSGDMRSAFTEMQVQFSDFVRDDISSQGDYNGIKWREAASALSFAGEIAHGWAGDVDNYNDRAQALMARARLLLWSFRMGAPATYQATHGRSPYQDDVAGFASIGSNLSYAAENEQALDAFTQDFIRWQEIELRRIVREYDRDVRRIREEFLEQGEERANDLERGPDDDATIRKMVDAGYLGWAPFNIKGPMENPPLPVTKEEAKQWSAEINEYLVEGKEIDDRYHYIANVLGAISSKAEYLSLNPDDRVANMHSNGRIRNEEIQVLRVFFEELDKLNPVVALGARPGPRVDEFGEERVHSELLDHFGAGLLVLSNPDLGGAEALLPESVRNVSHGHPEHGVVQWDKDMGSLNRMLGGAPSSLEGGAEFSANITATIGHYMNTVDNDREDGFAEETYLGLLDVSTRNDDANHLILSNSHDHPRYEENANAIKGLFTHNWSDDGAAVAKLMDWIPEASSSEDGDSQRRATEATLGLVEMMGGSADRYQALLGTGISVEDESGEEVPNASFGLVNPLIARSLGDVALAGIAELSNPIDEQSELERTRFFEFIMADEDTASQLYFAAGLADMDAVAGIANGDIEPEIAGARAATLRGMLDTALRLEALDRTNDIEAMEESVQSFEERWGERLLGLVQGYAYASTAYVGGETKHPGVGVFTGTVWAFQEFQFLRRDHFATEVGRVYQDVQTVTDPNSGDRLNSDDGSTYNSTVTAQAVRLEVLSTLVDNGDIQFELVKDHAPELIVDDNGEERIKTFEEIGPEALTSDVNDGRTPGGKVVQLLRGADAPPINQPVGDGASADVPVSANLMVSDYLDMYFPTYTRVGETEMSMERAQELRSR